MFKSMNKKILAMLLSKILLSQFLPMACFTGIPFIYNECTLDYSVGVGKDRITQAAPTIPNHMIWASTYNERRMPWLARLDEPTGKVSELCDGRGVHAGQDLRIFF